MYIMTQLVFDIAPIVKWLNRTSAQGSQTGNNLPVYIGVAGRELNSKLVFFFSFFFFDMPTTSTRWPSD